MTNNIYESLCDDVGAYTGFKYFGTGTDWFGQTFTFNFSSKKEFKKDAWRWLTKEYRNNKKITKVAKEYPPATAEQREKLLILVHSKYSELCLKKCKDYYTIEYGVDYYDGGYYFDVEGKNYPDVLYALAHKLVQEGVLSKEEVAKALKGEADEK